MRLRNRKSNAPLALNSDEARVRTETDDFNTAGSVQPPPRGMRTIIHTEGEQDLSEKDPARSEAFAQIQERLAEREANVELDLDKQLSPEDLYGQVDEEKRVPRRKVSALDDMIAEDLEEELDEIDI